MLNFPNFFIFAFPASGLASNGSKETYVRVQHCDFKKKVASPALKRRGLQFKGIKKGVSHFFITDLQMQPCLNTFGTFKNMYK